MSETGRQKEILTQPPANVRLESKQSLPFSRSKGWRLVLWIGSRKKTNFEDIVRFHCLTVPRRVWTHTHKHMTFLAWTKGELSAGIRSLRVKALLWNHGHTTDLLYYTLMKVNTNSAASLEGIRSRYLTYGHWIGKVVIKKNKPMVEGDRLICSTTPILYSQSCVCFSHARWFPWKRGEFS